MLTGYKEYTYVEHISLLKYLTTWLALDEAGYKNHSDFAGLFFGQLKYCWNKHDGHLVEEPKLDVYIVSGFYYDLREVASAYKTIEVLVFFPTIIMCSEIKNKRF